MRKFDKGDKVMYVKHSGGKTSPDLKHFEIGKIYEVECVAFSKEKMYTLVGATTYVFESQIEGILQ